MEQQESKKQISSKDLESKIKMGQKKLQKEKDKLVALQKKSKINPAIAKDTKYGIQQQIEAINGLEKMFPETKAEVKQNVIK